MRIVFMGTPDFAVESLHQLIESGANVVGVITAPDKPAGRGRKISESAVKKYAVEKQLTILQPTNLKEEDFLNELRGLKADLQVVVAFRMLPELVWNMPELGTINLHGSLLPQYRGAAPINWAIMNGDVKTGVSTFFLQHEIDTGDIIQREEIQIKPDQTAGELHDEMMVMGGKVLVNTIQKIQKGDTSAVPQVEFPESELKPAPKIFKEDCQIDWKDKTAVIYNKIRGLSPYPSAWTVLKDGEGKEKKVKIFKVSVHSSENMKAGEIKCDGKSDWKVGTIDGSIQLHEIQLEGKKRMPVTELLKGLRLKGDEEFISSK